MNNLAPIVLFVYNRPWHTQQTVEALQKNELAQESELFIYADNVKNNDALVQVKDVRDYIKTIDGFKKITIIERGKNWGLANSIIDGVTKIVNEYGKIIVLEDDLVTSLYFLKFMNNALDFYQNKEKVWHISGWNYPINTKGLDDVFLWRLMNCWGWATWADRWQYFEKNTDKLINEFSKQDIKKFNGVNDFWSQVIFNKKGVINTWAIYWYASIFRQNGLCLNPVQTFVENIGLDDSGVHCGEVPEISNLSLNNKSEINFVKILNENKVAFKRVQGFFKKQQESMFKKIIKKLYKMVFGKNQ